MTDTPADRPSLKQFDTYTDRNGQDLGVESPPDIGVPSRTQNALRSNPNGEAEAARIASGTPGENATDATEAETPPENLRRIGGSDQDATAEAIERATAAIGKDEA